MPNAEQDAPFLNRACGIRHRRPDVRFSEMDSETFARIDEAARLLAAAHGQPAPHTAIVLGSGLSPLVERLAEARRIEGQAIPHWPVSTATGHAGDVWFGVLGGTPVVLLAGRVHLYEGVSPGTIALPVRTLWRMGVRHLVLTNAAGGISPHLTAGALMLIDDHINMTGVNPLAGPNDSRFGPRFPDMSEVYSRRLLSVAEDASRATGVAVSRGTYLATPGPSYETPAEIRFFRIAGADAVGMSTVVEAIAARHVGLEVLGISCIANAAAGLGPGTLTHDEVLATARQAVDRLGPLLEAIVARLDADRMNGGEVA
jgi:purine-nucleoside phosphorylase